MSCLHNYEQWQNLNKRSVNPATKLKCVKHDEKFNQNKKCEKCFSIFYNHCDIVLKRNVVNKETREHLLIKRKWNLPAFMRCRQKCWNWASRIAPVQKRKIHSSKLNQLTFYRFFVLWRTKVSKVVEKQ